MAKIKFGNISESKNLTEASFGASKIKDVARIYGKMLSKHFPGEFWVLSEEKFKSPSHQGVGVRLVNETWTQVRFNFTKIPSGFSKDQLYISSIDYWDPNDTVKLNKPTLTLKFNKEVNVVQIWDKVFDALKNGKVGAIELTESLQESLNEDKISIDDIGDERVFMGTPEDRVKFAEMMGWKNPNQYRIKTFKKGSSGYEEWKQWITGTHNNPNWNYKEEWNAFIAEIYNGEVEENDLESLCSEADAQLDKRKYCDPEFVFEDIEYFVHLLISQWRKNSVPRTKVFLLAGLGGLGKTYHVDKKIKEIFKYEGDLKDLKDIVYEKSLKATPLAFYNAICKARHKVLYIDESDAVFLNAEISKMVKGVWDTSAATSRGETIASYATNMIPVEGSSNIRAYGDIVDSMYERGLNGVQTTPKHYVENNLLEMDDDEIEAMRVIPLPNTFYYDGCAICITNLRLSSIDEAVRSRSMIIDLVLSATDIFRRMQTIDLIPPKDPEKNPLYSKTKLESAQKLEILADAVGLKLEYDKETGNIKPNPKFNKMYEENRLSINMRHLILLNALIENSEDPSVLDKAKLSRRLGYMIPKDR